MKTTRQRQRLLTNGLMTVFLLSLLGGCGLRPTPNGDGTTPATTPAPDILGLKAELAAIENLVFQQNPPYFAAEKELTRFQESFQKFSVKYQNEPGLKQQIDKINNLLQLADGNFLKNSQLQGDRQAFDAGLRPIFADLKAGLNSFNQSSETTPIATAGNQNQTGKQNKEQKSTPPTNSSSSQQSDSQGDRQSGLTFGQVIFANFLAIGFTILLIVGIAGVGEKKAYKPGNGQRKSNNPAETNPQANTLPQQNNLDSRKNIDALTAEFNKLYSLISGLQEYSIKQREFNSLQQTLNSIQKEIKSIPRSIPESVSRTSSDDSTSVQLYLNQIKSLNQEKENKDNEIKQLQRERKDQSDEIKKIQAQLDQLSHSHTNAVSSVQYNQLEQRFNDLREEYKTLKTTYNNLEQSIRNNNAANQGELAERDRQLTVIQQKLDQVNSALTKVTAERDELRYKLDEFEEFLKKFNRRQNSNDNLSKTSPNEVFSGLSIGTQSNSSSSSPLTADIQDLINQYNQNPKSLQVCQTARVEFPESNYNAHRLGSPVILENTTKTGAYWVVTSSPDTWLFPPDTKLKLRSDYYTLSALYECHQYQESLTKFTLIKPAKVSNLGSSKWQLIEKGELEFTS